MNIVRVIYGFPMNDTQSISSAAIDMVQDEFHECLLIYESETAVYRPCAFGFELDQFDELDNGFLAKLNTVPNSLHKLLFEISWRKFKKDHPTIALQIEKKYKDPQIFFLFTTS